MGKKKAANMPLAEQPCPCGSGLTYGKCCEPLHEGEPAASPEALMRSRYTAYALRLDGFVLASWDKKTRPEELFVDGEPRPKWFSLKVESTRVEGDKGYVTVLAKARTAMGVITIHEASRFRRDGETWVYVDGDMID